jgi:4-hydroxyproline epimerase
MAIDKNLVMNHPRQQESKAPADVVLQIRAIDSHTAGEPTRVVIEGGPELGSGSLEERVQRFRDQFDSYRKAIVTEPRGSDVLVGALLCEPVDTSCLTGVIFFNNVGYLGMCGHGMIGVMETLKSIGKVSSGEYRIETPAGTVTTILREDGTVSVANVPSYRVASDVKVDVDGVGTVVGDVAWGGNWFFLVREPRQEISLSRARELQEVAMEIRGAVNAAGFPAVDHVELYGEAHDSNADSRNFVLCPGHEYDRSPCGTGTSAKLACLAADGKLQPGEQWVQEGVLGTNFVGEYQWADAAHEKILPVISGRAFVTAEVRLTLDPRDPFCWGIESDENNPS